jgi:hypothetical protein
MRDNNRNSILMTLVFCSALLFPAALPAQNAPAAAYRLIGTTEGPVAGAVFQDPAGQQLFYQLHEKLSDGSQLIKVRNDSVALKSVDGVLYDMYISHDTKTAASVAAPATLSAPATPSSPAAASSRVQPAVSAREARSPGMYNDNKREGEPGSPGGRRPKRHYSPRFDRK